MQKGIKRHAKGIKRHAKRHIDRSVMFELFLQRLKEACKKAHRLEFDV